MNHSCRRRHGCLQLSRLEFLSWLVFCITLMMQYNMVTALPAIGEEDTAGNTIVNGRSDSNYDFESGKSRALKDQCLLVDLLVELPIRKDTYSKLSTTHAFVRRCKGAYNKNKACVNQENKMELWHVTKDTESNKKEKIRMSWVSHENCKYQKRNCSIYDVHDCVKKSTTHYFDEINCNCTCIVQIEGESTCRARTLATGKDVIMKCESNKNNFQKNIHYKNDKDASPIYNELQENINCLNKGLIATSQQMDHKLNMLISEKEEANEEAFRQERNKLSLNRTLGKYFEHIVDLESEKKSLEVELQEMNIKYEKDHNPQEENNEKAGLLKQLQDLRAEMEDEKKQYKGQLEMKSKQTEDTTIQLKNEKAGLLKQLQDLRAEMEDGRKQCIGQLEMNSKQTEDMTIQLQRAESQLMEYQRELEVATAVREGIIAQDNELELKFKALEELLRNQENVGPRELNNRYNDIYYLWRNDHM